MGSPTSRVDPRRTHPDDLEHRNELLKFIASFRASVKMGNHKTAFENAGQDWRLSTLLEWAAERHIRVIPEFEGLVLPEGLEGPPEDAAGWIAWTKQVLRAIRLSQAVSKTQMDVRLGQSRGSYNTWELRDNPYMMSAMQRAVRALGGTFRLRLEHKHNPGLMRRISGKR